MLSSAPRFRTTVASGSVALALLVGGATRLAAAEQAVHDRLAWLRRPAAWQLHWSRPISASPPAVAAGLVVWLEAGAVHGVRAADGLPAWRRVPAGDTLLFPRSLLFPERAGRSVIRGPASVTPFGHLVYAVIEAGPLGSLVICLDCSDTAEGRLLWSAPPPAGCVGFDGPPAVDHEVCAIVARAAGDRGSLELVVHDARDGLVLWRRPLATGMARDGSDHARGRRQATLVNDEIVIADHAGSVWGFDRSGRSAWRYEYDLPARGGERPSDDAASGHQGWLLPAEPVVVAPHGLVIAAHDRGGVMMLDTPVQPPRLRWEATVGEPLRIVGVADGRVVVERDAGLGQAALVCHAAADGRIVASGSGDSVATGPAVMAGGVILRPIIDTIAEQSRLAIAAIDATTLQPCGPPCQISAAADGSEAADVARSSAVLLTISPAAVVVASAKQLLSLGPPPP